MPEIDVNNPPEDQRGTCPRCGEERLWVGERVALNALSRRDNKTYVCSPCGQHEAYCDMLLHHFQSFQPKI